MTGGRSAFTPAFEKPPQPTAHPVRAEHDSMARMEMHVVLEGEDLPDAFVDFFKKMDEAFTKPKRKSTSRKKKDPPPPPGTAAPDGNLLASTTPPSPGAVGAPPAMTPPVATQPVQQPVQQPVAAPVAPGPQMGPPVNPVATVPQAAAPVQQPGPAPPAPQPAAAQVDPAVTQQGVAVIEGWMSDQTVDDATRTQRMQAVMNALGQYQFQTVHHITAEQMPYFLGTLGLA